MKYLVYDNKVFTEFSNWNDAEYFLLDKPNAKFKKITSKKMEDEFKEKCLASPEYKQKIYVVILNSKVYRFSSWKETKIFISENSNCKYKSFEDEASAEEFINNNVHNDFSEDVLTCSVNENGVIELKRGKVFQEKFSIQKTSNPIEHELNCVIAAVEKAIELKEEQLLILYKNLGTEMWANGTWKATKEYSINYNKKINEYKKFINIDFKKLN